MSSLLDSNAVSSFAPNQQHQDIAKVQSAITFCCQQYLTTLPSGHFRYEDVLKKTKGNSKLLLMILSIGHNDDS